MRQLKEICNKWIPFPGFLAMMLFGVIFKRQEYCGTPTRKSTINHEGIHLCQALDFIEWIIKLIISLFTLGKVQAYRSISFEQEAYNNQYNYHYQDTRKHWSWMKYIFKLVWKS